MRHFLYCFLILSLLLAACSTEDAGTGEPEGITPDAAGTSADAVGAPDAATAVDEGPRVWTDLSWCEGETAYVYDPVAGPALHTFPDDYFTKDDAESITGLRVRMDTEIAPWLAAEPENVQQVYTDLNALDGFGVSAAVAMVFSGPMPELDISMQGSLEHKSLQLLDISGDEAVRVPYRVSRVHAGKTLLLQPLRPLKEAALHAAVVTTELGDKAGGCVVASPALKSLLDGSASEPGLQRLVPSYARLVDLTGLRPDQISAAVTFTTQAVTAPSVIAAGLIEQTRFEWAIAPTCSEQTNLVACEGAFQAHDFREGEVITDVQVKSSYTLKVNVWLPKGTDGPWPLLLIGHGLGGDRSQGYYFADAFSQSGLRIAVAAIDAPYHGVHPTAAGSGGDPMMILRLFGLDLGPGGLMGLDPKKVGFDGLVARDNFRIATFDRLQLLRLLGTRPDIDGDGDPDLDTERFAYWGMSLGGIMGPEMLALSERVKLAILTVAGGHLSTVVSRSDQFRMFVTFLPSILGSRDAVDRFLPIAQTLIEGGDPVVYAPYVLRDRLEGGGDGVPHVLLTMAVDDAMVPNVSTEMLARAMDVPLVPPVSVPYEGLTVLDSAPVSANLLGATVTAGFFQFDRATVQLNQPPVAAEHNNVPACFEGMSQSLRFLTDWLGGKVPVIVDPYTELSIEPLPE